MNTKHEHKPDLAKNVRDLEARVEILQKQHQASERNEKVMARLIWMLLEKVDLHQSIKNDLRDAWAREQTIRGDLEEQETLVVDRKRDAQLLDALRDIAYEPSTAACYEAARNQTDLFPQDSSKP